MNQPLAARLRRTIVAVCTGALALGLVVTGSSPSFAARSASKAPPALSAAELRDIVVVPPAPFAHLPDSTHGTGLMEPGNPRSGKISSILGQKRELVAAGFQRGWESFFVAPTKDVVAVDVFEFKTAVGPAKRMQAIRKKFAVPTGVPIHAITVPGIPDAYAFSGTGKTGVTGTYSFANGRFLVAVNAEGRTAGIDFESLGLGLAQKQMAAVAAARRV